MSGDQGVWAKGSLERRLALLAVFWTAPLLLAGACVLTTFFWNNIIAELDDQLAASTTALIEEAVIDETGAARLNQSPPDPRYRQVFSGRYWEIRPIAPYGEAAETTRSRSLWDERLEVEGDLIARALAGSGDAVAGQGQGPEGARLRVIAQAVVLPGQETPSVFLAAADRAPLARRAARFSLAAAGIFALFAAGLILGAMLQVRRGLAPLRRMGAAVSGLRRGDGARLKGPYPAELHPLAAEINHLLDHAREVVERSRAQAGNLAHALKTPLAALSNEAREAKGPLAEMAERQCARMAAQIDHHLRRARAAATAEGLGASAGVAATASDLARTLGQIHRARAIALETDIAQGLRFRGERQDLDDLLGNLLDNAYKYAASSVRLIVRGLDEGRFEALIEDDGPGLSATQRKAVLARGARLDEESPGTGLGLAIVSDLAQAYHGRLALEAAPSGGLRARLILPRAADGETRP